jgi:hypothetical protein
MSALHDHIREIHINGLLRIIHGLFDKYSNRINNQTVFLAFGHPWLDTIPKQDIGISLDRR